MTRSRIVACFWICACLGAIRAAAAETFFEPFVFNEPNPEGGRVEGFRPFYVHWTFPSGATQETTVLYPLFYYRTYVDSYEWSVFKLINRYGRIDGAPPTPETDSQSFDVWPFYFSKDTGEAATSYHAVLPIGGRVDDLLGYDRLSWVLFPLYAQTEKKGAVTTYTPWPIIRVTRGTANGVAVWPLFGHTDLGGPYQTTFYLWPLGWNNAVRPGKDAPPDAAPLRQVGLLPFYTALHGPGVEDVNYLLFFGHTDRTSPERYHETRYFWPFVVQGEGEDRVTERWAPFYTHSVIKGMDKTWTLWPLLRRAHWVDGTIAQDKTQFLYFLYWRLEQSRVGHPEVASAKKTYLWPFFSTWDNGAGRKQVQILSPLEGVFADNPRVRETWSPFFAFWRYDQRAPGQTQVSLFWHALSWSRNEALSRTEVRLGPFCFEFPSTSPRLAAALR